MPVRLRPVRRGSERLGRCLEADLPMDGSEMWKSVDSANAWASSPFPRHSRSSLANSADRLMTHHTISFEGSTIFMAAGALMGIRVGCSLLDRGDRLFRNSPADLGIPGHLALLDPEKTSFSDHLRRLDALARRGHDGHLGTDGLRAAVEDHRPLVRRNDLDLWNPSRSRKIRFGPRRAADVVVSGGRARFRRGVRVFRLFSSSTSVGGWASSPFC